MDYNGREKRRFVRAEYPCNIYILTAPLHTIKCKTDNIGAGGVKVMIDEKLKISSMVGLELYLSDKPIACKGRVVWVIENKDSGVKNKFDTGIEFYQISEDNRKAVDVFVQSLT